MAVSVSFDRVTKTFGAVRAVDGVTLTVEPGELFFLLGPSGCGKTTLLRCLAGFHQPDAGRIRIGDEDVTFLPPHRRETGMVFQSYALWPHLTIRDNVAFGLEMRRVGRADIARRVDEVLRTVRMEERAGDKPNQLSGGQQQRIALARALVIEPRCLLLDEPLSNLDAKLRLDMRAEIRRICKQAGLTAVYVTHDQKEALSIADRIAVIHAGRIRQTGTPQDVYRRPVDTFVAGFIGETNFLPGLVTDAGGAVCRVRTSAGILESRAAPPDIAPGTKVTLSIRPEAVRINTPPAGAPNVFRGAVHHTVYLGEAAQHQVSIPAAGAGGGDDVRQADISLKAAEMNPRVVARDTAEAAVIWMDPADVIVLPA